MAITDKTIEDYVELIRSLKPDSIPSMRQDSIQKRKTEVDIFARSADMNPQNGWGSARDASPGTPLWKRQFPQRSHPLLEQ